MMLILVPFLLQGLCMSVDEFYFHRKRGLGRWERWGHPLDTVSFILANGWLLWATPSQFNLWIFVGLAVASCLLITKDEGEHFRRSSPWENWLHAMLFMLHPVVLIAACWLWWTHDPLFVFSIGLVVLASLALLLYQTFYWNWWRRDQQ